MSSYHISLVVSLWASQYKTFFTNTYNLDTVNVENGGKIDKMGTETNCNGW